ncbi:sodium-dependent transporter [Sansalvadorimonas sp. 2012CJ34-2]|uniref:Sodium-dependent transporter n=1 Tax=Parendozoicomonas callyspongiae TaxID=2942213 RepID=A0ABT0PEY1_9GAMM|nr:sodium-dependent transporter [Sansalvadorimonas sp. 2012CJ34-2]MCL6269826.1 sodium-dependent transporter [Sansalvadorimonas sp. 2012CJ34-2]
MADQQRMSTNLGFILAVAGAAVGLGNIWRFPYMAGEHGGSLFLLFYLLFVFLMGVPAMVAEIVVGKAGRATPASSLRKLATAADANKNWSKVAWIGMLAAAMVLSFYSVVSGWGGYYLLKSTQGDLAGMNSQQLGQFFQEFLENPLLLIVFNTLFLGITMFINGRPVARGLERLNYLMMPLLYVLLILLVFYASGLSGFDQALNYLFAPNWDHINLRVLVEAMGHAFFTLAVGACCLMAYGAYMPEEQSIWRAVSVVVFLDLLVSVLTGIAIFSVVFSDGLDPSSGPGLMFITLPRALNSMSLGEWVLPLFFVLFMIATWTSSINLAEPLVATASRRYQIGRNAASWLVGICIWILGLVPLLSFNLWKEFSISGRSLFDLWTGTATNILLPTTSLLVLFFVGWVMPKDLLFAKLGMANHRTQLVVLTLCRYVAPGMVLAVFLFGLMS